MFYKKPIYKLKINHITEINDITTAYYKCMKLIGLVTNLF